jgi:hypothetical protein
MLDFAQRYTAQLDCTSAETVERVLTETKAFVDPTEADALGVRLVLPAAV